MSPTSVVTNARSLPDSERIERRKESRYPITVHLQYKLIERGQIQRLGSGRTFNISSHGLLFEIDDVAPASGRMELALRWPILLNGSCGLNLIIRGRIVRTDNRTVALRMDFHEFRTAGRAPQGQAGISR